MQYQTSRFQYNEEMTSQTSTKRPKTDNNGAKVLNLKDLIVESVKLCPGQMGTKDEILNMAMVLHPQFQTQFKTRSIEQALSKHLRVCPLQVTLLQRETDELIIDEPHPPDTTFMFNQTFCLKKAIVKAFNEISCPRIRTLDIETLKKHLMSQYADQIFKNENRSNGEDLSMDSMIEKQQT